MNKKHLITTVVLVALLFGGYFFLPLGKVNVPEESPLAEKPVISVSITVDATAPALTIATYGVSVPEGSSVYDAMRIARDNGRLDFNGREFAGLGFFVEEVNGIAGDVENGMYWVYSVNGIEAQVGVSDYVLHDGDTVTWEYEKSDF